MKTLLVIVTTAFIGIASAQPLAPTSACTCLCSCCEVCTNCDCCDDCTACDCK